MLMGPKITAQVMERGLDWQLTLANGAVELEQVMILQTNDGASIYVRNCGSAPGAGDVRIVPDIEAPSGGPYAFLNSMDLVGIRKLDPRRRRSA